MPVSYRTRGPEAGNDPKTRNGTRASVLLFRTRFLVEEAREVGGRGRGQCSHRHFMKIAPPVSSCPERSAEICYSHLAINSRYFISNTRSVARGMLRDDRFFLSPPPSSLLTFSLFSQIQIRWRSSFTVFAPRTNEEFLKKYRNQFGSDNLCRDTLLQ